MTTSSISLKDWIRKLDYMRFKRVKLIEDLAYCKMQLTGVKGVSYGNEIHSNNSSYDDKLIHWVDKIHKIEKRIQEIDNELNRYNDFKGKFKNNALKVIELYYEQKKTSKIVSEILKISTRRLFQYCKKIECLQI